MPDLPPPGAPADTAVAYQAPLSEAEIEALLADFRGWLLQAAAAPEPAADAPDGVDLHTLVGQFVALRQEVNLQTRASRTQQEQNVRTLQQFEGAVDALRRQSAAPEEALELVRADALRPLLKTLLDVNDSLALAHREVKRIQESLVPDMEKIRSLIPPPEPPPHLSWWAWLLGLGKIVRRLQAAQQAQQDRLARETQTFDHVRQLLASVLDGYNMSLQRLERTIGQAGLEPIDALGKAFDPETMEVVEVVKEAGRSGSEVIEEVRKGYLWQGRVFRFAQVKVARPGETKNDK